MNIGQKIRNAREDLDLSQEQVAKQIGMNQSSYSKIERDCQEPNLYQLQQIAIILNLDLNVLLNVRPDEGKVKRMAKEISEIIKKYTKES